MTATRREGDGGLPGGGNATARGVVLIVVAVVVGLLLLGKGFDSGFLPSTSDDDSDQAATDEGDGDGETDGTTPDTTPTVVTHAPAEVRVQVLNGGGPSGSAAAATTTLRTAGFTTTDAADTGDVPNTTILYADGFADDAQVVAASLSTTVLPQPMGATPPPPIEPGAIDVVVILGPDYTG